MSAEHEPVDFAVVLAEAGERVTIGGRYGHYKNPEAKQYEVVTLAIDEASEQPAVVYKALYGDGNTWIRSVDNFLETVDTPDGPKPRFTKL